MKFTFILLFVITPFTLTMAQHGIPIDSILSLIKGRSIYSDQADWNKIENKFIEKLNNSTNDLDSIKSFLTIFESLGDVHSSIIDKGNSFSNYPEFDEVTMKKLMPLVQLSNQETGHIRKELLQDNIVYLQIPSIQAWGAQANEAAQQISDEICNVELSKINGIIIDLRLNGGGQLSPMITGLNMLLGDNYLGGGSDVHGNELQKLEIKNHNLVINNVPMNDIRNKCEFDLSKIPVVILIGPVTRSSGSVLAISFKNREHTYFIGEATAEGYSTGNEYFYFTNDLYVNLSTTYNHDRKKNVYRDVVSPDMIMIEGDNYENPIIDKKVIAGINWILSNK